MKGTLKLIVGPPNSGKAGAVMGAVRASLEREPVLVVPSWDDVWRFEAELCEGGAAVGVRVITFRHLFELAAEAAGVDGRPVLGPLQRSELLRRSARSELEAGRLRAVDRSAERPGFVVALDFAVAELQAALIDPASLAERCGRAGLRDPHPVRDLQRLYASYVAECNRLGVTDTGIRDREAVVAMRQHPQAWQGRPLFLYGFDDLTEAQLELVTAIASEAEVTVAVLWEDRRALAARARLLVRLEDRGGEVIERRDPQPANTPSRELYELERRLSEPPQNAAPIDPRAAIRLLEAGGDRGEVELVAAEVARILQRQGGTPDDVAVVLRSPQARAPLYQEVFEAFGIPVAVDGSLPLGRTATGQGTMSALRAIGPSGTPADVVAVVRARRRPQDESWADGLERMARRNRISTAAELLEAERERQAASDNEFRGIDELTMLSGARGPALPAAVARVAARLAELPHYREADRPSAPERLELRAAAEIRSAMEELSELPGSPVGREELLEALTRVEVPLWRGGGGAPRGRVRVLSPYRARARRFRHLVLAGLGDDEFPRRRASSPFFDEAERAALQLPERADTEQEERYLFHACLSRPTHGLVLSRRTLDEDSRTVLASPFWDEVLDLLDPKPEPLKRELGRTTFPLSDPPNRRELARAIAVLPEAAREEALTELSSRGVPEWAQRVRVAAAGAAYRPSRLELPAVLDWIRQREVFSVTRLESYRSCPYIWFVEKELDPSGIDPDWEGLTLGGAIHAALERLFGERPGGTTVPTEANHREWEERGLSLLHDAVRERALPGMDPGDPAASRAAIRRLESNLQRLLAWEREAWLVPPDEVLVEVPFGPGEELDPLDLPGLRLEGRFDRIDIWHAAGGRAGILRDYKNSPRATAAKDLVEKGKLQLQLYSKAAAERLGIEPIGAIYHPLAANEGAKPRGILNADCGEGALGRPVFSPKSFTGNDLLPDLSEPMEEAVRTAAETVEAIRAGRVTRDPIGGTCPRYCHYAPICRIDRASPQLEKALAQEGGQEAKE